MPKKKRHAKRREPERPTGGWWAGYMFPAGWTAQDNLSSDQFGMGDAGAVGSDGASGSF